MVLDAALLLGKENEWWFGFVFVLGVFVLFLTFLISIQSHLKRDESVLLVLPFFLYDLIKKSLNVC